MEPIKLKFDLFTNNHKTYNTQCHALGTGIFHISESGFGTINFFENFIDASNGLVESVNMIYMESFNDVNELSGYIRYVYLVPIITKYKKRRHTRGIYIPLHITDDIVTILNITGKVESSKRIAGKYGDEKFLKTLQKAIAKNIAKSALIVNEKATIYKVKETEWELIYPEQYSKLYIDQINRVDDVHK